MTNQASTIETALAPISQAQRMLAEAKTLPDFRNLRDFATTALAWAKARGLGVEAENEASEVVLRAERGIGQNLIAMRDEGLIRGRGQHISQGSANPPLVADLLGVLDIFPTMSKRTAERNDLNFRSLARLDDVMFDQMVKAAREKGERLAKHNFYMAAKPVARAVDLDAPLPAPSNPAFDAFRRGAFALLGWEVAEDGTAGATRNGLLMLPDDELRTVATVIRSLALAYNEAKAQRGG